MWAGPFEPNSIFGHLGGATGSWQRFFRLHEWLFCNILFENNKILHDYFKMMLINQFSFNIKSSKLFNSPLKKLCTRDYFLLRVPYTYDDAQPNSWLSASENQKYFSCQNVLCANCDDSVRNVKKWVKWYVWFEKGAGEGGMTLWFFFNLVMVVRCGCYSSDYLYHP